MSETVTYSQVKSYIGNTDKIRATLKGLGIRRMHESVTRKDSPELRKEIYQQLDLWDSVIMEASVSQAGEGYVKNSFTLKSKEKMTHKEVYDYMANHPDIRDFKIYGEF